MSVCDWCGETLQHGKHGTIVMYSEPLCAECLRNPAYELGHCLKCGNAAWIDLNCLCSECERQHDGGTVDYGNPFAREGGTE